MEGTGVIVLDTRALLWMDRDDPALGLAARRLIEDAWRAGQVAVSASSFRETAMLAQRGHIVLPLPATEWRSELLQATLITADENLLTWQSELVRGRMRGCDDRNACVPEIGPQNRCLSPAFPVQAGTRSYDSLLAPSGLKRSLSRTLSSSFRVWLRGTCG